MIGVKGDDLSPWYEADVTAMKKFGAGGILFLYRGRRFNMLKSIYPGFDWDPWKFKTTPRMTNMDPAQMDRLISEVESALHIQTPEQWYLIVQSPFSIFSYH